MIEIGMEEAQSRLLELVQRVQAGEEVSLTSCGQVVAELRAPSTPRQGKEGINVLDELKKLRNEQPINASFEELMEWKNEGRM